MSSTPEPQTRMGRISSRGKSSFRSSKFFSKGKEWIVGSG
jgi:hypothetical protein